MKMDPQERFDLDPMKRYIPGVDPRADAEMARIARRLGIPKRRTWVKRLFCFMGWHWPVDQVEVIIPYPEAAYAQVESRVVCEDCHALLDLHVEYITEQDVEDGKVRCTLPPPGWWCSRAPWHDGPCAARPIRLDEVWYLHGLTNSANCEAPADLTADALETALKSIQAYLPKATCKECGVESGGMHKMSCGTAYPRMRV